MKSIAVLLAVSLLSSCALLKAPARTLKAVGRTLGVSADDASLEINDTHPEISPDNS